MLNLLDGMVENSLVYVSLLKCGATADDKRWIPPSVDVQTDVLDPSILSSFVGASEGPVPSTKEVRTLSFRFFALGMSEKREVLRPLRWLSPLHIPIFHDSSHPVCACGGAWLPPKIFSPPSLFPPDGAVCPLPPSLQLPAFHSSLFHPAVPSVKSVSDTSGDVPTISVGIIKMLGIDAAVNSQRFTSLDVSLMPDKDDIVGELMDVNDGLLDEKLLHSGPSLLRIASSSAKRTLDGHQRFPVGTTDLWAYLQSSHSPPIPSLASMRSCLRDFSPLSSRSLPLPSLPWWCLETPVPPGLFKSLRDLAYWSLYSLDSPRCDPSSPGILQRDPRLTSPLDPAAFRVGLVSHPFPAFTHAVLCVLTKGAKLAFFGERSGVHIHKNHSPMEDISFRRMNLKAFCSELESGTRLGPFPSSEVVVELLHIVKHGVDTHGRLVNVVPLLEEIRSRSKHMALRASASFSDAAPSSSPLSCFSMRQDSACDWHLIDRFVIRQLGDTFSSSHLVYTHHGDKWLSPPFFVSSPLNSVFKSETKRRIVHDLSFPPGRSVNDFTPHFSVQLAHFDAMIDILARLGMTATIAKLDIKAAYKQIPVQVEDWPLLGMCVDGVFFLDTVVAFGARSAAAISELIFAAIQFVANTTFHVSLLQRYCDDFCALARSLSSSPPPFHPDLSSPATPVPVLPSYLPPNWPCLRKLGLHASSSPILSPLAPVPESTSHFASLLRCFRFLGVPFELDKMFPPSKILDYLGILIDICNQTLSLPAEKKKKIQEMVTLLLHDKKASLILLRSLVGSLSHVACIIRVGRTYLRGLYACLYGHSGHMEMCSVSAFLGVDSLTHTDSLSSSNSVLSLSPHALQDLGWWSAFLSSWEGCSYFPSVIYFDVPLYTDASSRGFGAALLPFFTYGRWPSELLETARNKNGSVNITFLEVFAVVLAVLSFLPALRNRRIRLMVDNAATCLFLNAQVTPPTDIALLLHKLHLVLAAQNISLFAFHVNSRSNIADPISRGSPSSFFSMIKSSTFSEPHSFVETVNWGDDKNMNTFSSPSFSPLSLPSRPLHPSDRAHDDAVDDSFSISSLSLDEQKRWHRRFFRPPRWPRA